ncbi:MAG TPA: serine/threonine-protein kinase [Candidatus Obscuribacterales bacterium]
MAAHRNAGANPLQTQVLVWAPENGDGQYELSVKSARSAGEGEALWILALEKGNDMTSLWNYMSPDVGLIYSMVEATVKTSAPAAVIPDSLKPPPGSDVEAPPPQAPPPKAEGRAYVKTDEVEPINRESSGGDFEKEGSILLGRYEIVNEVGRGGMGVVYKARHLKMDRIVAIKVLHGHLLEDSSSKKRFEQEVAATSSLNHPNCVLVYDCDFAPSGRPFLVMEYIEGISLKETFKRKGPLSLEEFCQIFIQCCEGLAHAHSKGIIHRDLKPSNVMLVKGSDGKQIVKIVDFGVAKIMPRNDGTLMELTRTGDVVGSPHYMSPEQCMGSNLDWRSDLYSLGCMMYEGLMGRVPLLGENPYQAMYMHIHEMPPLFAAVRPGFPFPRELEEMVFRAMAKQPHERYQSAVDLVNELKRIQKAIDGGTPIGQPKVPPSPSAPPATGMVPPHVPGMMPPYQMPMPGMMPYPPGYMPGMYYPPPGMAMPSYMMPPHMQPQHADGQRVSQNSLPLQQPAQVPAPTQPAPAQPSASPSSGDAVIDLLKQAELISAEQIEKAQKMKEQHGGELAALLVASGAIKRCVRDAATKCKPLLEKGHLKPDHAVTLLKLCNKKDLKYEDAIEELGWRLG